MAEQKIQFNMYLSYQTGKRKWMGTLAQLSSSLWRLSVSIVFISVIIFCFTTVTGLDYLHARHTLNTSGASWHWRQCRALALMSTFACDTLTARWKASASESSALWLTNRSCCCLHLQLIFIFICSSSSPALHLHLLCGSRWSGKVLCGTGVMLNCQFLVIRKFSIGSGRQLQCC